MKLSGKAKVAGVMGWPVGHSRSPMLHSHWLRQYGIDGAYVPMAVRPEKIGQALAALPALGFAGCNLTLPHKETSLPHLAEIDGIARRIGAVNTIVVRPDGTWRAPTRMPLVSLKISRPVRPAGARVPALPL